MSAMPSKAAHGSVCGYADMMLIGFDVAAAEQALLLHDKMGVRYRKSRQNRMDSPVHG